eukprot:12413485-Karenia_brevis.AAC.1
MMMMLLTAMTTTTVMMMIMMMMMMMIMIMMTNDADNVFNSQLLQCGRQVLQRMLHATAWRHLR